MKDAFGWQYPAGAENDPNAPWNQVDDHCELCGEPGDDCECAPCLGCNSVIVTAVEAVCEDCRTIEDKPNDKSCHTD